MISEQITYQTGRMIKDPSRMTETERTQWQRQCAENARDYLFSIDQPLVYKRPDGHTVAEYKNGRILVIR